jgi:phosphocarrier protein
MSEESTVKTFTIKNRLGLHARAASKFVHVANKFESEIMVAKDDQEINGKSIMGILILAAACGTEITVSAEGSDSALAVDAIGELINRSFDEEG